ncbi:unnamed protein product [Rotaria sp. Silwood1]|nr:unnamed protein product [Rotaria sp. Silwood1]
MYVLDYMDISSTKDKINYWQRQQDVNQITKSGLKIDQPSTPQFSETDQFYVDKNQLKRTRSDSDQCGSPFKKRHFTEPFVSPVHTDNDDDDNDSDSNTGSITSKNSTGTKRDDSRRRVAHIAAEQKRRNAIRKGFDSLQSLVPDSHLLDPVSSQKVSKAAILKRSMDYLSQLNKEKQQLNNQLEIKKKEIFCLRTVQKTYEDILEMNTNSKKYANASINDELKFKLFQNITDAIFISFDQAIQTGQTISFSQFASTILRWVEDSCKPSVNN